MTWNFVIGQKMKKIRLTPIVEMLPANDFPVQLESEPLIVELMNIVELSPKSQNSTSLFSYSLERSLENVT